jgi:hypothetical protein
MPEYDRQLILKFLTGRHGTGDGAVRRNSWKLKHKDSGIKTHTAEVPFGRSGWIGKMMDRAADQRVRAEIGKLTANSRLYLEGHGYWKARTLADWGPEDLADLLADYGLREVKLISLVACELAKAQKHENHVARESAVGACMNSFAQKFHYFLGFKHRIFAPVQARLRCVLVAPDGSKTTRTDGQLYRYQARSKVRFDWGTEGQTMAYVDYETPEAAYA